MSRQVYAHYMVGLTDAQELSQWTKDINDAQAVGIDGFALNCGPSDAWTLTQLHQAYAAAEAANFQLFVSFDMAVGDWDPQAVTDIINEFKDSTAQAKKNEAPIVSTFEGPDWSVNWPGVRDSVGGIFLMPDWSSLGPERLGNEKMDVIDGAFYWQAWPNAGEFQKTSSEDVLYTNVLGDKSYMMGVSPGFYTNLPQYSKNWFFTGDSLWFDRWNQAIELLPEFVQIITWNDFGESHYISDSNSAQVVSGAGSYVDGYDHSGFRAVLPYLISAYKTGDASAVPTSDEAVAWYRTTPAKAGSDGGTIWGQSGSLSASDGTKDTVNVMTVTVDETDIIVSVGESSQTFHAASSGANFFQMPFDGLTGNVTIEMSGRTATGPSITNTVPATGYVNFNSLAISL